MRRRQVKPTGNIIRNTSFEGEAIEKQIARLVEGETLEVKGKTPIYTEKKDGVLADTNIRSDKFEMAMEAIDYVNKTQIARSNEYRVAEGMKDSTGESTGSTGNK